MRIIFDSVKIEILANKRLYADRILKEGEKMKKVLSIVLALAMCLSLAACAQNPEESPEPSVSVNPTEEAGIYTPGTYTATARGHEDGVQVTVTVDANSITDVTLDVSKETESIGGVAADQLKSQIMEAQSAEIDGVSGATETSNAVKMALQDCLNQAMGVSSDEKTPVADGTYSGTAPALACSAR